MKKLKFGKKADIGLPSYAIAMLILAAVALIVVLLVSGVFGKGINSILDKITELF